MLKVTTHKERLSIRHHEGMHDRNGYSQPIMTDGRLWKHLQLF